MAGNRSFINYILDRFYNDFYSYLEKHIEENQDNLDLEIQNVHNVGEIILTDMEIKMASINDLPGMEIEFDVVIEAEIEISEDDYHYDDYDLCNQWFLLNCKGNLENSLDDFEIMGIEVYSQRNKIEKPLSDALVPYIRKEELDSVATDFLNRYYPEVLKSPVDLDPIELACKMGLTVEVRDITKDLSIFGQVYFHDSEAELYDSEKDEIIIEECRTKDISGNGLKLLSNLEHKVGDKIICQFDINNETIKIESEIVRLENIDTFDFKYVLGIKFIDIEERDRDTIIKFIFEKERLLRGKGLI